MAMEGKKYSDGMDSLLRSIEHCTSLSRDQQEALHRVYKSLLRLESKCQARAEVVKTPQSKSHWHKKSKAAKLQADQVRNQLVESVLYWAVARARLYNFYRRLDMTDLCQIAFIGAIRAVETWKPERGALTSWTLWQIRKSISNDAHVASYLIRVPATLHDLIIHKRPIPQSYRLTSIKAVKAMYCISSLSTTDYDDNNRISRNELPCIPDPLEEYIEADDRRHRKLKIEQSIIEVKKAMEQLNYQYQEALMHRLKGLTYEEIGKYMGVSRERIRQIIVSAVRKLKMLLGVNQE